MKKPDKNSGMAKAGWLIQVRSKDGKQSWVAVKETAKKGEGKELSYTVEKHNGRTYRVAAVPTNEKIRKT